MIESGDHFSLMLDDGSMIYGLILQFKSEGLWWCAKGGDRIAINPLSSGIIMIIKEGHS
jgi:hypothetical protein